MYLFEKSMCVYFPNKLAKIVLPPLTWNTKLMRSPLSYVLEEINLCDHVGNSDVYVIISNYGVMSQQLEHYLLAQILFLKW